MIIIATHPQLQGAIEAAAVGDAFVDQMRNLWARVAGLTWAPGSGLEGLFLGPKEEVRAEAAKGWMAGWMQEFETDRAGTLTSGTVQPGALLPADAAPEHFRLYAAVQKEWFQYDIYARVCMLLGFSSFVQSLAFYGNGHIVVELRAFYVAHATAFTLEVLHVLLLRFDIIQGRVKSTDRTPAWFLWLGPVSVLFATVGMSLDFHVHFSIVVVIFTWICIFGAYVCQICYQLRILEVILPDDLRNPLKIEETIGDAWWPASWRCPSAFAHVLYFVAPPNRSQPGQFDIVREVKEGAQGNAFEQAGVPLMEARPVDTSEATANPGMSPEEIIAQVQYLDRLFDYFMSDQVFDALTDTNKQRVKDLFSEFSAARRKGTGPEAMRAFADCLMALEGITAAEGMKHEGEASTDAGYTSASAGRRKVDIFKEQEAKEKCASRRDRDPEVFPQLENDDNLRQALRGDHGQLAPAGFGPPSD
ncbi:unnamed protein product [Effrenium voratum]|uniref:Uncharacterized protein n=1 Tax=Effrenium voratum TaxID=2562239 RepID=A0AA36NHL3_9DINO|nr:unnamed protein product [Effrenium voratum]